jgi:hypothetical protein
VSRLRLRPARMQLSGGGPIALPRYRSGLGSVGDVGLVGVLFEGVRVGRDTQHLCVVRRLRTVAVSSSARRRRQIGTIASSSGTGHPSVKKSFEVEVPAISGYRRRCSHSTGAYCQLLTRPKTESRRWRPLRPAPTSAASCVRGLSRPTRIGASSAKLRYPLPAFPFHRLT